MDNINEADIELISRAKAVIAKNYDYEKNNHTVGAAVRCKNGNIYVGVNIYLHHGACAEVVAMGAAITAGNMILNEVIEIKI